MVIVTYGCYLTSTTPPTVSSEHKRAALFTRSEIPRLNMPDGYKRSIKTWFTLLTGDCADTPPGKGWFGPDAAPRRMSRLLFLAAACSGGYRVGPRWRGGAGLCDGRLAGMGSRALAARASCSGMGKSRLRRSPGVWVLARCLDCVL